MNKIIERVLAITTALMVLGLIAFLIISPSTRSQEVNRQIVAAFLHSKDLIPVRIVRMQGDVSKGNLQAWVAVAKDPSEVPHTVLIEETLTRDFIMTQSPFQKQP